MRRYFVFLLSAILAVSFAAPAAHGGTPAKQRATCATLKAAFPFGVASTAAAAASAAARGFAPPQVSKAIYAKNSVLDRAKTGAICLVAVAPVQRANATVIFNATATRDPAIILAAQSAAVPGSPAFNYLSYFSKATSAGNWATYESKGLVIPTLAPGAIAFTGAGTLPAQVATVVEAGSGAATAYTMQYDPYGKVQSWSTTVGPLDARLFAASIPASGYGITINPSWVYRTNTGSVNMTAAATNSSGRPLRLASATYSPPAGGAWKGYAQGTCIQNGQTIPVAMATESAAAAGVPSSWEIEVLDCDFYATGFITVVLPSGSS